VALTVLPTKTDGSIGREKSETPVSSGLPVNLDYYETAEEAERAKDALIAVCNEVGLSDGSTVGSLVYRVTAIEGGAIPTDVIALAEQGSAPAALANSVKLYAKDNAGTSALYARTDDGVEHELTGAAASTEWPVTIVNASGSLTAASQVVEVDATGGAVVLTLPPAASSEGVRYIVRQTDSSENTITLTPDGTDDIEGGGGGVDYLLPASGAPGAWSLYCNGAGWLRSDHIPVVTPTTSAATWTVEEAVAAPSSVANTAKLFALEVGGRTEPQVMCSDGEKVQLTRTSVRAVTSATDTLSAHDETVLCSTASNNIALTPPNPANHAGRMYLIWKTNAASTNKITFKLYGSEKINGTVADYDLPGSNTAARGAWHVVCDGTDWYISGGAI